MTLDPRPGLGLPRLARLMNEAVRRCRLDLSGCAVLTEAAAGAYAVTPVLAALAGAARVCAVTRSTRHGSADEVTAQTLELAALAGVRARVEVVREKTPERLADADVVTNSGHVRPLDAAAVAALKPAAVVPLMYEAWEFRPADVDLAACRARGVAVAGVNECHPDVNVFPYLGTMAVKLLLDAGVAAHGARVLLLCDNPFRPFLESGLRAAGAEVETAGTLADAPGDGYDAFVVALRPGPRPVVGADEARAFAARCPGAVLAQFWGDVERPEGVPFWPPRAPGPGHMGILPSAVGPEPVVRLQAGGLKVGELLWRARAGGASAEEAVAAAVRSGFGQSVPGAEGEPCTSRNWAA